MGETNYVYFATLSHYELKMSHNEGRRTDLLFSFSESLNVASQTSANVLLNVFREIKFSVFSERNK